MEQSDVKAPYQSRLPHFNTLDEYLDYILPNIEGRSEDLHETEHYQEGEPWVEFRDDITFDRRILHFFNEENEYLISIDGNVYRGTWRLLPSNKIILEYPNAGTEVTELYDLAFMNDEFFILKKNGNQNGGKKYFLLAREPVAEDLDWRELMEKLDYHDRHSILYFAGIVLLLAAIFFFLKNSF